MRREAKRHLYDIAQAAELIAQFTAGKTFRHYLEEPMLRAAVERKFEIIGEALAQLAKRDASAAARIGQFRRIIAFRNILVHGYADVDDQLVWDIAESKLADLRREVAALLHEARQLLGPPPPHSTGSSPLGPTLASTPVWTSNQ